MPLWAMSTTSESVPCPFVAFLSVLCTHSAKQVRAVAGSVATSIYISGGKLFTNGLVVVFTTMSRWSPASDRADSWSTSFELLTRRS